MYLHESTKDTQIHNLEHPLTAIRKSDASARDWNIEFLTILRGIVYFQNACSTFSGICLSLSSKKAAKIRIIAAELNHFYCRPEVPFSHMRASVAANPWPRAFASYVFQLLPFVRFSCTSGGREWAQNIWRAQSLIFWAGKEVFPASTVNHRPNISIHWQIIYRIAAGASRGSTSNVSVLNYPLLKINIRLTPLVFMTESFC